MTRRTERVAEAIRRLASEILHQELRDPRIAGFITVTKVEITPDLRFAKVFYSVMGDSKKKKLISEGLKSARSFVKKHIGDALNLRYTPDISFRVDPKLEYRARIDEVLSKIHGEEKNERDTKNKRSNKKT